MWVTKFVRRRQVAELYKASAGQGLAPALRDLGLLYLQGIGVEQSFEKAVHCFKKVRSSAASVAKRGSRAAQVYCLACGSTCLLVQAFRRVP